MRRLAAVTAALAGVLSLAACTGEDGGLPGVGPSRIEVDTPALRADKAAAGIEDCEPGSGASDLPVLTLPCLGGGPDVDLSTLQGPLLVNLWNSPCGPCQEEMPVLQEFHERYGDRVPVLGIDVVDTQPEAAISLAELTGATYPQLADPGGELFEQELRIAPAFPQFVVVRADGTAQVASPGGLTSLQEVVDLVEGAGVRL